MTTIRKWGQGNYPVGSDPWSGQPRISVPSYDGFTPNVAVAAEEMNWLVSGLADAVSGAQVVATSFGAQVTPSPMTAVHSAMYDPFRGVWLLGGNDSGAKVRLNYGNDSSDWFAGVVTSPGGAGDTVVGLGISPAGANWFASCWQSGTLRHFYSANSGATWMSITTSLATSITAEWRVFNGKLIAAVGDSSTNAFITDPLNTPDGTPTFAAAPVTGQDAALWLFECSPSLAMAVTRGSAYFTSTDGSNWTARTLPGTVYAGGDTTLALTYNAAYGYFVLAVGKTSGATLIAGSSDGVNWSVLKTFSTTGFGFSAGYLVSGLTSVGNLLVAITDDTNTLPMQSGAGVARMIYSVDGGYNWAFGPASLTGGSGAQQPRIYTSGSQLLALNATGVRLGKMATGGATSLA